MEIQVSNESLETLRTKYKNVLQEIESVLAENENLINQVGMLSAIQYKDDQGNVQNASQKGIGNQYRAGQDIVESVTGFAQATNAAYNRLHQQVSNRLNLVEQQVEALKESSQRTADDIKKITTQE